MAYFSDVDEIVLTRDCKAIQIPDGTPLILPQGELVAIRQVLGGMFTVRTERGYLVRIDGKDADAIGQMQPPEDFSTAVDSNLPIKERVWEVLKTCYDPEIPVNVVELGLVYECEVFPWHEGGYRVEIQFTLTAPGCGMGDVLKGDIEAKVLELPEVKVVNVEIVFDPPWDQSMMSEAARLQLGMM